jgi:AcrR family transcriptional regulator
MSSVTTGTKRPAGERTRAAILREAVSLATVDGLEGLSIGDLATVLGMSKSGLYAHFGSKVELQLATVEEAATIFRAEVIEPARAASPGVGQLVAVCDSFVDHLQRRTFPGGCFFAGAALEMGPRSGPVHERIAVFLADFARLIRRFVATAHELDQLADAEDPDLLAFEINGIILAANASFVLFDDARALDMARQVVRRRLRVSEPAAPKAAAGSPPRPERRRARSVAPPSRSSA